MHGAEEQVTHGQYHGSGQSAGQVVEGLRDAEGQDEHRRHAGEDGQLDGSFLGAGHIGQPGVRGPGPPQQHQHQRAAEDALPTQLVSHERGHLGQRKDEHQVEEQLQWGDSGLLLVLAHELAT